MDEARLRHWLAGAWDAHVHAGPDLVPRAAHACDLLAAAGRAGLRGVVLKDHTGDTCGLAAAWNHLHPAGPRAVATLTLNPPAGGWNAAAVERAARLGARVVWAPTYGARHHLEVLGVGPFPLGGFPEGLTLLDGRGRLAAGVAEVLATVARHDLVLATGHLAPVEGLRLVREARAAGVERVVVTHPTEPVTRWSVEAQRAATQAGAWLEHCLLALTPACAPDGPSVAEFVHEILAAGPEHVVLSSDYGKADLGDPVAGLAGWLERLAQAGLAEMELRRMTGPNVEAMLGV